MHELGTFVDDNVREYCQKVRHPWTHNPDKKFRRQNWCEVNRLLVGILILLNFLYCLKNSGFMP